MQDKHESHPPPSGITSQMSRDENAPQRDDGAEGGLPQSSSWKFRQENLRPIRRNFLCDAYREAGTHIIGRAPGPPTLLLKTPSEGEETPSSMWDTNPVLREIKALITPYKLPNELPMRSGAVSNTTQGEYGKPPLAQPNEAPHKEHRDLTNGKIGTEQVPEEVQASGAQGDKERNGKGKTPVSKETQEPQQVKGSKDGISKASTAPQQALVDPSSYHDRDGRMCLPQGQSINQGTPGQQDHQLSHDQFRAPAPSSAMQAPHSFHFQAQPPNRDFRIIFPDLNSTWFNDEGLIQLPPLRGRPHASPPNPPSDIDVPKPRFDPTS
ncbi:hypothetical protein L211DRAFT_852931 [Terfezia boudieri ATCC MYA-4762]|uniref:Uncharacterized protein n=1 Tax=Terfezia boudieri ATCC MYA-4762 TaxID=1051890 RepID=A0A3N4LA43_9PEZI|nr:hypothetical protein L211DRAFT_852931 [Terfezia boudieri ATCC MYA-4762]